MKMTPLLPAFVGTPELDRVYHCDALTLLRALPDASVDLIVTDPPYNIGKARWDTWPTNTAYIGWLDGILAEYRRVLKQNGSLYLFCATRLQARVELAVERHFNVLTNIRWEKPNSRANGADREALRAYFPASESCIFAEQYGADKPFSDALIDGNATYWQALKRVKTSVFGDYLKAEFNRAGVTNREIAALFPSRTGGLTGCVSNWLLGLNVPTPEQYQKIRDYLNAKGSADYLRREYEDLRREYEDLRRPFHATEERPYTDVWHYRTVNAYPGKHICEKPMDMMRDIIEISSRTGALVLDTFVGSGNSLRAARELGRHWIGCDTDLHWVTRANNRINAPIYAQIDMFAGIASSTTPG